MPTRAYNAVEPNNTPAQANNVGQLVPNETIEIHGHVNGITNPYDYEDYTTTVPGNVHVQITMNTGVVYDNTFTTVGNTPNSVHEFATGNFSSDYTTTISYSVTPQDYIAFDWIVDSGAKDATQLGQYVSRAASQDPNLQNWKPFLISSANASGMYADAFKIGSGSSAQIVIAFQASHADNLAQVKTDVSLGLGGNLSTSPPATLTDAKTFVDVVVKQAESQGIHPNQIFVTGHSLGGAEAEYVMWKTPSLGGGITFGAPGLPGYDSTGTPPHLIDIINRGDPVGNYASDTKSAEPGVAPPSGHDHVGKVFSTGTELEANTLTKTSQAGVAGVAALWNTVHSLGNYQKDLGVNFDPSVITKAIPTASVPSLASAQIDAKTTLSPSTMSFTNGSDHTVSAHTMGETLVGSSQHGNTFQGTSANLNGDLIKLFGGNDVIDATDLNFAHAVLSYNGSPTAGTLSLNDGVHSAGIGLIGDFNQAHFHLASDLHGGTNVTFG
jgi:hypothetical protein